MDFSNNSLVATTEEKVVNESTEGLDSKECEENKTDDLVGGVVSTCLFGSSGLATEHISDRIGHDDDVLDLRS